MRLTCPSYYTESSRFHALAKRMCSRYNARGEQSVHKPRELVSSKFSGEDEVTSLELRACMHPRKEAIPSKEDVLWQQAIIAR
jgi:hypothetical protein